MIGGNLKTKSGYTFPTFEMINADSERPARCTALVSHSHSRCVVREIVADTDTVKSVPAALP
jgi:hypothetical protein